MNMNLIRATMLVALAFALLAGCSDGERAQETADPSAAARADAPAAGAETPATAHGGRTGATSPGGDFSAELCAAHGDPASLCLVCDPSLRDPKRLWCGEHGRYEDRCWICHPELQEAGRLYCNEHGLYEDECAICHPDVVPVRSSVPESNGAGQELQCVEHGVPEAVCGTCHPELADGLEPGQSLRVRMPSMESVAKAGVVARTVALASGSAEIEAVGRLDYDRNRLFRVTAPSSGIVREVRVDLGDAVEEGQALVVVASPDIAEAKANLLQAAAEKEAATAGHARERELHEAGISPEQDVIEAGARARRAKAAVRSASQRLGGLGLTPEEVQEVEQADTADANLALRAPFAGTVVSRNAVIGDVVETGREFLQVADLRTLWVEVSLAQTEAAGVRPGIPATVHHRDGQGAHNGVVTWVADRVDPGTGMVEARAEVPNPDRDLRAGTFVRVVLPRGGSEPAALVPADAVHRFGGHPFVFVEEEADLFDVRRVIARPAGDHDVALLAGINPEDRVVVEGSFLIKSEFQKARLGAGCVD